MRMVTTAPGIAVGVSTADCGPVLFADPPAQVIGAAHAGWRGALTGVLEATIAAMERCGASATTSWPRRTDDPATELRGRAGIRRALHGDDPRTNASSGQPRRGHAMFDLAGYIASRLSGAGISGSRMSTAAPMRTPAFFSYRRSVHRKEPDYGRHINAIALAE